jgi:hypothetical protein
MDRQPRRAGRPAGNPPPSGRLTQLEVWRRAQGLTYATIGERVCRDGSQVRRHALGLAMPRPDEMVGYLRITGGEVQPNHFLGLPGVHPAQALRALERSAA